MHTIPLIAKTDRHGQAWLRQSPLAEGALWLRVGPGLDALANRLRVKYPGHQFAYDLDFTLVEAQQVQLGMLEKGRYLTIFDFDHPTWVHEKGIYCSSCMAVDLSPTEDWDDGDAPDHPSPDDPFAAERAEDLKEAVRGMTIEQHADCAACGQDFITEHWQTYLHSIGDLVYCQDCRRWAEQRFGTNH